MRHAILDVTALVLLAMGPATLAGQTPPPRPLSLAAALELAERQNLDLAAAERQREVARAEILVAGERPNPIANFDALRDEPHEGLFFTQDLELGGKRRHRIEVAQASAGLTEARIGTVATALRRQVREAYYALAVASAKVTLQQRMLELAQQLARIAHQRYDAGDVPWLEVLQAELGVHRAEADLEIARQQQRVALVRLNGLLNVPPETVWQPTDGLEALPPLQNLTDLLRTAQAANPELVELDRERRVEESRVGLARAEQIPNLTLEFGTDFNSPHDFRVGPRSHMSIELPLLNRRRADVAAALAGQREAEARLAAARRRIQSEVEQAYLELQARLAAVALYRERLLPATRQLEQMSQESYRAGKTGILTVLDAQRGVQELEASYLDSLFAAQSAFAALEQTVGTPLSSTGTP
jgi:cobalt-zinc-cadmium efflux system outer membrane protein